MVLQLLTKTIGQKDNEMFNDSTMNDATLKRLQNSSLNNSQQPHMNLPF